MSTTIDKFEIASRDKVRFDTSKGEISSEELWDLSLQSLDVLAKAANKKLKDAETEISFISTKSKSNTELELKLEILKHIIGVKMEEKDALKNRQEKQNQLRFLQDLKEKKKTEQMESLSVEEIEQRIAELTNSEG